MKQQTAAGNLAGKRVEVPHGAGSFAASRSFRALVTAAMNAIFNIKVKVPFGNGTTKDADVKISGYGCIVTLPTIDESSLGQISGGATQYKIVSDGGDYWVCKTWDGTTLGSSTVNVYKPHKLRAGSLKIASEVIRTVTYTYTYTAVTVGSVTGYYTRSVSGSDSSTEVDYMIPDPIASDIIYAAQVRNDTGVSWIDLNVDGRAWAAI